MNLKIIKNVKGDFEEFRTVVGKEVGRSNNVGKRREDKNKKMWRRKREEQASKD